MIVSPPAASVLAKLIASRRSYVPPLDKRVDRPGVLIDEGGDLDDRRPGFDGADVNGAIVDARTPRWSVVTNEGTKAMSPFLIAGLPESRAMVCVGPPLLPRAPSSGLTPTRSPLRRWSSRRRWSPSSMRLLLPETMPARSPPEGCWPRWCC